MMIRLAPVESKVLRSYELRDYDPADAAHMLTAVGGLARALYNPS
jgi:hypothetical protein